MGLGGQVGSLRAGKRADLIAVRLDRPHAIPVTDPYSALVYSARAEDVIFTLCNGQPLYMDGIWPTLDINAVLAQAKLARAKLGANQ